MIAVRLPAAIASCTSGQVRSSIQTDDACEDPWDGPWAYTGPATNSSTTSRQSRFMAASRSYVFANLTSLSRGYFSLVATGSAQTTTQADRSASPGHAIHELLERPDAIHIAIGAMAVVAHSLPDCRPPIGLQR